MGRWVACSVFVAACSFRSTDTPNDGRVIDAPDPQDVSREAMPDAKACFGTGFGVQVCFDVLPSEAFDTAGGVQIDNDLTDEKCDSRFAAYCVIAGTTVTITDKTSLVVNGQRPLVIVATGAMQIDGTIDVASHIHVGRFGAGSQLGCIDGTPPTGDGGGYGGTFGTVGGSGGNAGGGVPAPAATIATLSAGCKGSDGAGGGAGAGGAGGGIAYLIAGMTIDAQGTVNASGAAGSAAATSGDDGAGGGGSGGLIVFDAPVVNFGNNVKLFANGGGGGEANETNKGGHDGHDPMSPGAGGTGGSNGGNGGNGGDGGGGGNNPGQTGFSGSGGGGGGGGGGGVGAIRVFQSAIVDNGNISPPPN